jgi:hypothetical protein
MPNKLSKYDEPYLKDVPRQRYYCLHRRHPNMSKNTKQYDKHVEQVLERLG